MFKYGIDFSADPALGFQGQLERVEQMKVGNPNIHVLDQFTNPANPEAHFMSTGIITELVFIVCYAVCIISIFLPTSNSWCFIL